jgi:hypothetical protein
LPKSTSVTSIPFYNRPKSNNLDSIDGLDPLGPLVFRLPAIMLRRRDATRLNILRAKLRRRQRAGRKPSLYTPSIDPVDSFPGAQRPA